MRKPAEHGGFRVVRQRACLQAPTDRLQRLRVPGEAFENTGHAGGERARRTLRQRLALEIEELVEALRRIGRCIAHRFNAADEPKPVGPTGERLDHAGAAEKEAGVVDEAFQDEGNAEQQANRGTFDPAYLNYTMGKLMIRKLREDWTATRGGRKAWKQFHDQFLQYGGPPIPLVRRAMMGSADPQSLF